MLSFLAQRHGLETGHARFAIDHLPGVNPRSERGEVARLADAHDASTKNSTMNDGSRSEPIHFACHARMVEEIQARRVVSRLRP
jgi:hypothetical protein